MNRQVINLEICDKLAEFFSNPKAKDLRFFQGLQILKLQIAKELLTDHDLIIEDNFNEESSKTYKQLNESLENMRVNHEK